MHVGETLRINIPGLWHTEGSYRRVLTKPLDDTYREAQRIRSGPQEKMWHALANTLPGAATDGGSTAWFFTYAIACV